MYQKQRETARHILSPENHLRWMPGVYFGGDASRARIGNLAENLNVLRKTALVRIKAVIVMKGKKRPGARRKIFRASLDGEFLRPILFSKS